MNYTKPEVKRGGLMKRICCILLAVWMLAVPCMAAQSAPEQAPTEQAGQASATAGAESGATAQEQLEQQMEQQLDASGAGEIYDETPEQAKDLLEGLGVDKLDYRKLLSLSPSAFFAELWKLLLEQLRRPLVILASIMGVAVLCTLVDGLNVSIGERSLDTVFNAVAVLCISTAVVNPILECIRSAAAAIQSCADFILSFVPVFVSLVAVGGQPVSATTYNTFLLLTCEIISKITAEQLVPLICIYLAFCIVGAVTPSMNLSGAASTAKSVVTWGLGLLVTIFVGLLGMQSLVAAGADSVAIKAGKFLVGSFVPVVGKALSDALTTAQSCVKLIKTTVGAYAVVVACMTFLPSLVQTAVWYLAVNLGSVASDILGAQQIGKVLKACASALSLLLAIIVFVALLFIISTTIMLVVGMNI